MEHNGALQEKTNTNTGAGTNTKAGAGASNTTDAKSAAKPAKRAKYTAPDIENALPYDDYVEQQALELYREVDLSLTDILDLDGWMKKL